MTPLAFPIALMNWQNIAPMDYIWLVLIGLTGNIAHIAMTKSFINVELTTILPFDFMRLVFVGILSYIIFGDVTNLYDIAGSIIIIGSSIYIARREIIKGRVVSSYAR